MPCSPRRRIRLVTVTGGCWFCRPGRACQNLRRFSTSNGCQDHTVLPYATRLRPEVLRHVHIRKASTKTEAAPFVLAPGIAHKQSPPCDALRNDAAASTASHPNVRDDRDTPLLGDETGAQKEVICGRDEAEYFSSEIWTGQIRLIWLEFSGFWRNAKMLPVARIELCEIRDQPELHGKAAPDFTIVQPGLRRNRMPGLVRSHHFRFLFMSCAISR